MGRTASIDIKRPRTDDRRVWDVVFGVYGFPAILLAHKLKLFPLIANRPRSLPQVCVRRSESSAERQKRS